MKITFNPITKRFLAQSKYHEKDILKSAGFRWDPEKKLWWTNDKTAALRFRASFDEEARKIAAIEEKRMEESFSASALIKPSPGFFVSGGTRKFFDYQLAGIEFALGRKNTLLADEMGLGKSGQAIGVINASPDAKRVLIICPASLKINWAIELSIWLSRPARVRALYSNGKHRVWGDENAELQIEIINYDIVGNFDVKSQPWDWMILDESHYLKNGKSKRRREVWGGREQKPGQPVKTWTAIPAKRTLALTGTPINNRPEELWTMLRALDGERWTSAMWERFHVRYCGAVKTRHGWDTSGADNLEELNKILRGSIMCRRLKKDCLDLPEKMRKTTVLETTREIRKLLEQEEALQYLVDVGVRNADPEKLAILQDFVDQHGDKEKEGEQTVVGALAKIRRLVGELKAPLAVDYAKELLEDGLDCLVIFAHHKSVIAELVEGLKDYGVVTIVGGDSPDKRQQAVEMFQKAEGDSRPRVFIGSITAAGVGITLTRATHTLFVETDWVPSSLSQAEDRTHRIGTKQSTMNEYLIFEGSIDTRMIDVVAGKTAIIDQITK